MTAPIRLTVYGTAKPQGIPVRLWSKVVVDQATGCWLWCGAVGSFGYGAAWSGGGAEDGRVRVAHRLFYELIVGDIPEGLVLDHLCRVRRCVRPDHLEPVTNQENILRGTGWAARYAAKTHCPQGHPYAGSNLIADGRQRRCRICREAQRRVASERLRKPVVEECRNGHPFEGNRYIGANGEARCTSCQRDRMRRFRERKESSA